MIVPQGAFSRYPFAVLSNGTKCRVIPDYRRLCDDRFDFPGAAQPLLGAPKAYWERESPNLRDFDSIICVQGVDVWPDSLKLRYVPTTYFKFLLLNLSLDVPLGSGRTFRTMYEEGTFGKLQSLENPERDKTTYTFPTFGNSLGITIVLVSKDGFTIAARRSETSPAITTNKGDWQCAVGSQVKRHQPRFLGEYGDPTPWRSAWEALLDEQGERVYRSINATPICRGLVYRLDFHHCEIVYEFSSNLEASQIVEFWKAKKGLPSDASEVAVNKQGEFDIRAIDVRKPKPLLRALTAESWAPQHAAGALLILAAHGFEREVQEAGLDLRLS